MTKHQLVTHDGELLDPKGGSVEDQVGARLLQPHVPMLLSSLTTTMRVLLQQHGILLLFSPAKRLRSASGVGG